MENTVESYRKFCLRQQTELRQVMMDSAQFEKSMAMFLSQHAMLHSAKMAQTEPWSFEDAILDDLPAGQARRIPPGCDHSVAWLIWHSARCEDITMNLLVAGSPQVLLGDGWLAPLKITARDTGNAMDAAALAAFSQAVDLEALRAYRLAVGRRTRHVAQQLQPAQLKEKVDARRMQKVFEEGALVEAARGIADYWAGRTIAGLLLMPATRHNLVHLNEALELKRKRP